MLKDLIFAVYVLCRFVVVDLPRLLLIWVATAWLHFVLWLYRKRTPAIEHTGAEVACVILERHGIAMDIMAAVGWVNLFDPRSRRIYLSQDIAYGSNIGAFAIAAHEVGHALQRRWWFAPWWLRQGLVPVANLGLSLCFAAWCFGAYRADQEFLTLALACFGVYVLFLTMELVCEYDASRRAIRELVSCDLLNRNESWIARRILGAALLTYIAAFVGSLGVLVFFGSFVDWAWAAERVAPYIDHVRSWATGYLDS